MLHLKIIHGSQDLLDFSGLGITSLAKLPVKTDVKLLKQASMLKTLDLSGNNLKSLKGLDALGLLDIKEIKLRGNPLFSVR